MAQLIALTLAGFILGSLPFSVWVGRLGLKTDIRAVGDHNPGATNVWRSGGLGYFLLALALDISKGAIIPGLAVQIWGISGWSLLPLALAPTLGHAFSPFLGFRGGKAIAATFGVWIGLTLWRIPLVALLLLTLSFLWLRNSGWAVLLTLSGMLLALLWWREPTPLAGLLLAQAALLAWTHRQDLRRRPTRRLWPWLTGTRRS